MANDDLIQKQLLSDVEDSLRHDQMVRAWKEYAPSIIAGIVLAILLTGTLSAWRAWQNKTYEKATIELAAALQQPDPAAALSQAAKDLPAGHRAIGSLAVAGTLLANGKDQEALAALEQIRKEGKLAQPYRALADIMAIRLAFDQKSGAERPVDEWLQTLSKIGNDKGNPWRYHADLQGALIAAHDLNDFAQARKWLAPVVLDADVAPGLKDRAKALDSLYAAKASQKE